MLAMMTATSVTPPPDADARIVYRGAGLYQPQPLFEVSYRGQEWQADGSTLQFQELDSCRLQLRGGGFGVPEAGATGQKSLGSYTWQTSTFAGAGLVSYGLVLDQGYYLIHLYLPNAAPEVTARRCREAAESVIASFRLL